VNVDDLVAFAAAAIRGHRLRTSLSLLGVAVGVASVVLLTSLGEGARAYVVGEFSSLGSNLLIVLPGKTETTGMAPVFGGVPHDLTLEDCDAIARRVPGVRRIAPISLGTAVAKSGSRSRELMVLGTTPAMLGVRQLQLQTGRYLPAGEQERDRAYCVIGTRVQRELFPGRNPLGEILRVGDERFRIVGVLAPRGVSLGTDFDDSVHVPITRQLRMFNRAGIFRALVEVGSHADMPAVKQATLDLLRERHDGEDDVTVITQDAMISTFGRILAMLTAVVAGIAAISLSVAGLGVMNVMLVSVSERTREIGLLKALGATSGQVLRLFLVEAAMLTTLGGVAGVAVAIATTRVLGRVYPDFPIDPPAWAIGAALAVAAGVGLAFGAIPARRAARQDPVVALSRR
jgi:putative ABC transport system permease protein